MALAYPHALDSSSLYVVVARVHVLSIDAALRRQMKHFKGVGRNLFLGAYLSSVLVSSP